MIWGLVNKGKGRSRENGPEDREDVIASFKFLIAILGNNAELVSSDNSEREFVARHS